MLEDFRLKVFVAVAQQKSFTRAAAVLGISQPAVSQHVSELERQLSVKLFERLHGETVLTDPGKVFMKYAERINSDYLHVNKMFNGLNDAQVKICASREIFDYLLSVLLVDFIICHPNLTFMRTSDPSAADIVMTLISDDTQKGMFALDAHPSDAFAMTDLWPVLADFLN